MVTIATLPRCGRKALKPTEDLEAEVNSTKDLGKQLTKVYLEPAAQDNATYADIRLVNTVIETVSMINENPASEESNDLGAGIRVLYQNTGWEFASTDEVDPENIRETTRKALSLARSAATIGSRLTLAKEPTHVASWESPRKKDSLTVPTETKFEVLRV